MVAFFAVAAPLAPATDTTALARPLLPPTTTFSTAASVPHFSVSLFTLSFSITGAPLNFTSASMVPPPWAVAVRAPPKNATPPMTRVRPVTAAISLRIARPPSFAPSGFLSVPARHTHHQHHGRER